MPLTSATHPVFEKSVSELCSLGSGQVDFDQLQDNLAQMERRCKASWDHLKVIAKHEMKPALKQKMSDFLKDCAERIIILKIVHRRIINRSALGGFDGTIMQAGELRTLI